MESKLSRSGKEEEEDVELPGFRFYPTDEELTGFYLRRKAEKKHSSAIEFIKQIDIYMYDPWDLPRGNMGSDEECYFFCLRGRKYKNSIRPNRVTSSGYWKATGIDKEIYGHEDGKKRFCIGLKKSLVYYKGSSGKGTKTDWMMHEYRLPRDQENPNPNNPNEIQDVDQVWTLCRIFKRTSNHCRKQVAKADDQWKKLPSIHNDPIGNSELKNCDISDIGIWNKLDFHETHDTSSNDISLLNMSNMIHTNIEDHDLILSVDQFNMETPNFRCFGGLYRNEDWDELGAVVNAACSQFPLDSS